MTTPRFTAQMQVDSLRRLAEGAGGFALVLAKGDVTSGQILVVLQKNGSDARLFGRQMAADFSYQWAEIDAGGREGTGTIADYCQRARDRDPDLWVVELDVADGAAMVAQLKALG